MLTRRSFLASASAASTLLAANRKKHEQVIRPNLLLLLANDASGNPKIPNIDALARRGTSFQNAIACGLPGATGRATILSGRTPMQHGIAPEGGSLAANEILLSDIAAAEHYEIGYSGTWDLGTNLHSTRSVEAVAFLNETKPFFLTAAAPTLAALVQQIPSFIAKLHDRNIEANTLIVLAACGATIDSPHIPLIFCWPGHVPVQEVRPEFVSTYDLFPTLAAALGLTPPDNRNLCGHSFLPIILGKPMPKKTPWHGTVFSAFGNADQVADNRFLLILREDKNQLYDLRNDPGKKTNQFANRNFITARDELRRNLNQWKTQYSH